jgi:hypothetical protein
MFSTTIKRSVATLGVVAGLLAAAGPASAQIGPGTMGVIGPDNDLNQQMKYYFEDAWPAVTGATTPTPGPGSQVATSEVFELNTFGGNDTLTLDARGTQVGIAADAGTGDDRVWNNGDGDDTLVARGTQVGSEGVKDDVPLETVSFIFKGEMVGLEPNALGTQVGSEGVKAPAKIDEQMKDNVKAVDICCWTEGNGTPTDF